MLGFTPHLSSAKPKIANGIAYKGKYICLEALTIQITIINAIPPAVGLGVLWELLFVGKSAKLILK